MKNTIPALSQSTVTMNSKEIAELTGKRHDHVLRDIDNMLKGLYPELGLGFKTSTYKDSTGKENRQFELDRDSAYCLVAGYDANARMRIIKRWQDLEAATARPMSPAEVLIHQGQIMLALEHEQARQAKQLAEIEQKTEANERRLNQIETATDHFTIIGYHRLKGLAALTLPQAAAHGRTATTFCKQHGIEMGSTPDPRFGRVGTYPQWVLDELFIGLVH